MSVLDYLKAKLAEKEENASRELAEAYDLRVAIEAIEREKSTKAEDTNAKRARPGRKRRGSVQRAVTDAIREGYGEVQKIRTVLKDRGIDSSSGSISNTISRLQDKKIIRFDHNKRKWVIAETPTPSVDSRSFIHPQGSYEHSTNL